MRKAWVIATVGLLAPLAGCGSVVSGAHGGTPGQTVTDLPGGSAARPAPSAVRGTVTVTEADNGANIRLLAGQRLRVVLDGGGERWHRPASSGAALRLAAASGGYPGRRAASALFLAVRAGPASVRSMTDLACLHTQPACLIAQRVWSVHVTVTR